jgi:hypothetical protein
MQKCPNDFVPADSISIDVVEKRIYRHFFKLTFLLLCITIVALGVIYAWIYFAGPNTDTMLTFNRNYDAHSLLGMFRILANQDQAPLPQLLDYILYRLGFSELVALQAASSALIVIGAVCVLAKDLKIDSKFREISLAWRPMVFALGAAAIILSSSFSAVLTWVRYSSLVGIAWYAAWVLEEHVVLADTMPALKRRAAALGFVLGLGLMISFSWGVVIVASSLSLIFRRQFFRPGLKSSLFIGAIPGILTTIAWFIYAGGHQFSLIMLRTHGAGFHFVKTIGKTINLFIYPLAGSLLFPGVVNAFVIVATLGTVGLSVVFFLHSRRELIMPFVFYVLVPIPFYIVTNVNSGYVMMGPGLVVITCAIKGVLRLSTRRAVLMTVLGLPVLLLGMLANLRGFNTMSPEMFANKSRVAVDFVHSRLAKEHALSDRTLLVAADESTRFLIDTIPDVQRHFLMGDVSLSAPNIKAMLQYGFQQDQLTPKINRVALVLGGERHDFFKQESSYVQHWLQGDGFHLLSQKDIGLYSSWLKRAMSTNAPAQYIVQEWVR